MKRFPRGAVLWMVGTAGFVAGACWQAVPSLHADVRQSPPRAAFQAGGERSLEILGEMSATLKRIEARVERIEKTIAREAAR